MEWFIRKSSYTGQETFFPNIRFYCALTRFSI
ncbi:DUF4004 family protein [Paenibacillus polymyxa]